MKNQRLEVASRSRWDDAELICGHRTFQLYENYLTLFSIQLPQKHPWLYKPFSEHGFHSVRRSDRYWAGLSTDLIIEQVMMRSIKSRSGLIRSPGFTETVRLMWLYSMYSCAQVHDAMTSLTDLAHRTSEQHVELTCTLEAGFRRYGRRIQLVLSAQPL